MKTLHTFTATLCGNKRDTNFDPKILLKDIEPNDTLDRDHCWVQLTQEIEKLAPKGHQKPVKVTFTASTKEYLKQGTTKGLTLTNIQNIKRIK